MIPYFSLRSLSCSSFFFVSIFWNACKKEKKICEKTKKKKSHLTTHYLPVTATNITMNYINTPHEQRCFILALRGHHSSLDTVSNRQNIKNQRLSTCKQHLASYCNCALLRPLLPLLQSTLTRSTAFHTPVPNVRFHGTQITKQR